MLYHFWTPVIQPILKMINAKTVVEVGAEEEKNTRNILIYCQEQDAILHVIDVCPLLDAERWKKEYSTRLIFHQGKSLDILPTLSNYDAVLIDGDHNWYTVYRELKTIEANAQSSGHFPVVFIHDIAWPHGRRDSYWDPSAIPQNERQPYEQGGPIPERERLGSALEGAFCPDAYFASREGGPHNGILTAIEDFLEQTEQHIRCTCVPGFFGMAILTPKTRDETNPSLRSFLDTLDQTPLKFFVESLEKERITAQLFHQSSSLHQQELIGLLQKKEANFQATIASKMWKRGEEAGPLLEKVEKLEHTLNRIYTTRSWRWMMPLRFIQEIIRTKKWPKRDLPSDQTINDKKSPSPKHHVPHTLPPPPVIPTQTSDIAVIIPCHNYGRYLSQAIESVLAQTLPPREILVVDDASDDDTFFVAKRYSDRDVRYTHGTWKSVATARNEGARLTTAPYLVFLDADDCIPPHYLAACKEAMDDPTTGIAYGDALHFGNESHFRSAPSFDRELLMRENYISSCAMIRRPAFDMAGGYRECHGTHQDWDLYRRILAFPWNAKRAETYFFYRHHEGGMKKKAQRTDHWGYVRRAMLLQHPITIFTPFAGRQDIFPDFLKAIRNIDLDPSVLRIHWHDTSGDPAFGSMLREALATLSFERTTYSSTSLPKSWGETPASLIEKRPRHQDDAWYYSQLAVSRAYNSLLTSCDTAFALTLEDDILIQPDTIRKLLEVVDETTVAVLAPYYSRFDAQTTVRQLTNNGKEIPIHTPGIGVEEVAGGGFGCTLFRVSALKNEPIYPTGDCQGMWYDHRVFKTLRSKGKILCHWDTFVEHRGATPPSSISATANVRESVSSLPSHSP